MLDADAIDVLIEQMALTPLSAAAHIIRSQLPLIGRVLRERYGIFEHSIDLAFRDGAIALLVRCPVSPASLPYVLRDANCVIFGSADDPHWRCRTRLIPSAI